MPDHFQHEDQANGVRQASGIRPSGLPIFSTEPLTEAERAKLSHLQEQYRTAVLQIELCLRIDRVDAALDTMLTLASILDGAPEAIARTLGSNR